MSDKTINTQLYICGNEQTYFLLRQMYPTMKAVARKIKTAAPILIPITHMLEHPSSVSLSEREFAKIPAIKENK